MIAAVILAAAALAVGWLAWTARLIHVANLDAQALMDKLATPEPVSALDWPELQVRAVVPLPDDQPLVLLLVGWPAHPEREVTLLLALDGDDHQSVPVLGQWCATHASVSPSRQEGAGLELRRRRSLERVHAALVAEDRAPVLPALVRVCGAAGALPERGCRWRARRVWQSERVTAAELLVRCLENEGVRVVFGIPGEENIRTTMALDRSSIRYILTRHEQAAAFMAEMYARVTGEAGVVSTTLGPGAINMQLGVADAHTNSTPLVAISAQVGRYRSYKESHQFVDLVSMFAPITKWSASVPGANAIPEMVRKAFKLAQTERPGAVYLAVPEDVDEAGADPALVPLPRNIVRPEAPSPAQVARAAEVLRAARCPIVLAGHGAARAAAGPALALFAETFGIPVATTFHGKGVLPDDHPDAVGTIGFMAHDHVNFGFDEADLILAVGYELEEFDPVRINPGGDKKIIHIHRFPAEVDAHYSIEVGIEGDISASLDALTAAASGYRPQRRHPIRSPQLLRDELDRGRADDRFPLAPQRIVADTRAAVGRDDVVLVDTGAVKMWMARLYPTYAPNTCLISNGLSTMGFALPGALGVKLAKPDAKVLAVVGDGAFLMNSQEIETAARENIPLVVLIWQDDGYGLIGWKMDLEVGAHSNVAFTNPDIEAYAASFGATGYRIRAADELLPTLQKALAGGGVSIISCPVDYRENLELTTRLGQLDERL